MPELPEVETTLRGIQPHVEKKIVQKVIIRQPKLRWPIPQKIITQLPEHEVTKAYRRAKYLLLQIGKGTLIMHLGMSGSIRVLPHDTTPTKHDHFDLVFEKNRLRLRDPRKFGAVLWTVEDPLKHKLLNQLGPEPLSKALTGEHLYRLSRKRSVSTKEFIMNAHVVVGVGNIYATEALFESCIHPKRAAGKVSLQRYELLAERIKAILKTAIKQGGTTLRDFTREDGKPGYFVQELKVYGRAGLPCVNCATPLKTIKIGQRASAYCPSCQR